MPIKKTKEKEEEPKPEMMVNPRAEEMCEYESKHNPKCETCSRDIQDQLWCKLNQMAWRQSKMEQTQNRMEQALNKIVMLLTKILEK